MSCRILFFIFKFKYILNEGLHCHGLLLQICTFSSILMEFVYKWSVSQEVRCGRSYAVSDNNIRTHFKGGLLRERNCTEVTTYSKFIAIFRNLSVALNTETATCATCGTFTTITCTKMIHIPVLIIRSNSITLIDTRKLLIYAR